MAALACSILSLTCCLILCFLVSGPLYWCRLFFLLRCFLRFTSPEKKLYMKRENVSHKYCLINKYSNYQWKRKVKYNIKEKKICCFMC